MLKQFPRKAGRLGYTVLAGTLILLCGWAAIGLVAKYVPVSSAPAPAPA